MKVKIKSSRPEKRIQVKVGKGYIQLRKTWREITPNQFIELFEREREVLDFYTPEFDIAKKVADENKKVTIDVAVETIKEEVNEVKEIKQEDRKISLTKEDEINLSGLSREKVEEYARDTFGIELDRRKSVNNMIKDLKNELKKK